MSAGLSQVDRLGTKGNVEVDINPGGPTREFRQCSRPQFAPLVVQLIQRIVAARNWTLVKFLPGGRNGGGRQPKQRGGGLEKVGSVALGHFAR